MDGKIRQIFNNMEYGNVAEVVSLAANWFRDNPSIYERFTNLETEPEGHEDVKNINTGEELATVYTYGPFSVAKILESAASAKEWRNTKPIDRAKILNNFAKEVAGSVELISQIEICARGILSRDTKEKSVPLIVEYLQFYSNFAANIDEGSKKGLVVAVISTDNFLGILGFILGPVLAAGHNLVIHAETRLSFIIFLLIELSVRAGVPKGAIRLIPSSVNISVFLESGHVDFITVFGNLHKEYSTTINCNKKCLLLSPLKIPALVFNSADINSACDSIIKSVWSYQGMLPYSVRNVFVQEDILETFLGTLKERLKKLKLSASNERIADITYPSGRNILLLKQAIQKARQDGIEIYQPGSSSGDYLPTVFVGASPDTEADVPFAVVLSFRTASEAVALANNNKQAFGAIVWTENVSLANEVTRKLKVTNVWVNTEGILSASVPFSAGKESGKGYFGGKEALDEYLVSEPERIASTQQFDSSPPSEDKSVVNAIATSKKAQESWGKLKTKERIQLLKNVAANANDSTLEERIYQAISRVSSPIHSHVEANYDVNISVEPLGVLAIKSENDGAANLIIAAVLLGNSVMVFAENAEQKLQCERLVKALSAGGAQMKDVATILEFNENMIKLLQVHKEVKRIFVNKNYVNIVPLGNIPRNYPAVTNWGNILSSVVSKKAVWTTVGQSFL